MLYVEAMDFWDEPLNCVPATKKYTKCHFCVYFKAQVPSKTTKTFHIKRYQTDPVAVLKPDDQNQVTN